MSPDDNARPSQSPTHGLHFQHHPEPSRGPLFFALLSLAIGLLILGIKFLAWHLTGSVALLSDALESIVNVVAASVAVGAVWWANQPADANHPYGHGKAEFFSAGAEGALILVAAVLIVVEAWERLQHPTALSRVGLGLGVSLLATVLNGGLAVLLVRMGRELRSLALEADGHHLWTDVFTSVGVVVGVGLADLTGLWVLDPLLAMLVAANIVRTGWSTVRRAVGGLMDESLPQSEVDEIAEVIRDNARGALEFHDLRTRSAARVVFIQFHLIVPGRLTVEEAHRICDRIEEALHEHIAGSRVSIHVEPEWEARAPSQTPPDPPPHPERTIPIEE